MLDDRCLRPIVKTPANRFDTEIRYWHSDWMGKHESATATRGTLKRVAPGLCRYSTSGVYFAHVRIGGKLFRESLETTDRKTADRKLRDFRRKQEKVEPRAGKITLSVLADRYGATLGHLAESTVAAKEGILARLKSDWPEGEEQNVGTIKPSDCDTWIAQQAKRVGRSHYNAYVQLLKDVMEFAVRDRILAENPAAHLKYLKRETPIRHTPSLAEFRAIVDHIRNQKFSDTAEPSADFVEFIGLAGLGQAEASSLTWADVDFQRDTITTFRHKTRQGFTIPIYPQVRALLERLRGEIPHPPDERVFRIKDAKKAIAGACKRLRLPAYTHRSFRRLFITTALERGVDVKVVSQWQGHRDRGKLILDTYSHVNPVHSQRMAQLMSDNEPNNLVEMPEVNAAQAAA